MLPIRNEAAKVHLVTCFADALQKSIGAKMGGRWFCAASTAIGDPALVAEDREALVMQIRLRGTLHGELRIEIASDDVKSLLELDGSESLLEAWRLVMQGLVQRLPKRAVDAGMFAFSVESCDLVGPFRDYAVIGRMELGRSDRTHCVLQVLADDELVESLRVAEWSVSRTTARGDTQQAVAPELGRVIDVPLAVTLRFGQRSMRLREVLELNAGALVELDRQVEDPVDLILDERVIARGEVVIVDGNYGLRVTEIVERPSTVVL
jgi:flagellar motor switch protein FliN/FliY